MNLSYTPLWIVMLAVAITSGSCKSPSNPPPTMNKFEWKALPDLPGTGSNPSLGVSAPFTGIHNDMLIVAGGCNFPDVPVAEGGTKKYYDDLFVMDLSTDPSFQWKETYKLPYPVAYGASVTTTKGVICIGGNNSDTKLTSVLLICWNTSKNKPEINVLPSLPYPMDNLAATAIGEDIYAIGGNCDGKPSNQMFRLNIDNPENGWETMPAFPGPARLQPVAVAQHTASEIQLIIVGGYQPAIACTEPIIPTDVLAYSPSTKKWNQITTIPCFDNEDSRTLTGGCATTLNKKNILLMGGVNYNRFMLALQREKMQQAALASNNYTVSDSLKTESKTYLMQPETWYQFNTTLLQYNLQNNTWDNLGEFPQLARAGAGIVSYNNCFIIINGELKPGIRTPQINMAILSAN